MRSVPAAAFVQDLETYLELLLPGSGVGAGG